MPNIWDKKVQELILSQNKDNVDLALILVDEPFSIYAWYLLGYRYHKELNLPYALAIKGISYDAYKEVHKRKMGMEDIYFYLLELKKKIDGNNMGREDTEVST